ncbi:ZIP family metal transporter [Croceicoccus naphthovorans]|uniref:Zinc transporter n=1 Tax=Croceicoccus naphthovorans TaxID=1348774 RepID=A0A0G3XJ11_9SPHN|nr:zinc transporter [Croceicoccus naphthovorans]AKM10363.1 zinc transporter [Croceicoccus naphthovorans]MBB3990056.1 ZIP family zinc transporter [Croceicoccus naphthovorans]
MGLTLAVVAIVSGALIIGALIGVYGKLRPRTEGFIVALAGGALLLSLVTELIEPTLEKSSLLIVVLGVSTGAVLFTVIDYWIDEKWGSDSGGGLLAAVTTDGVPENLALGVALIAAGPKEVAALAASILLSNLPEAASGARSMRENQGWSKAKVVWLWTATAALLSMAAIVGNLAFNGVSEHVLGFVRCVAAGAVVASLGTEVFPKAFKEDAHTVGIATALGVLLALILSEVGGG